MLPELLTIFLGLGDPEVWMWATLLQFKNIYTLQQHNALPIR